MRTRRRTRRFRERLTAVLAVAGAATLMTGFVVTGTAGTASAEVEGQGGQDHWYVCKYVGKPGVDERLKEGLNPISVASPSIDMSPVAVGAYFGDAQERSYVLAEDTGQTPPSVSKCPGSETPTVVTPSAPTFIDPTCDDKKAKLIGAEDTDGVDYSISGQVKPGGTVVVTAEAKDGYVFPEGATTSWQHAYPTIKSLDCGGGGHHTFTVTPEGEPEFVDPCGTKFDETILPPDTKLVDWVMTVEGSTVTVTAQLQSHLSPKYVLDDSDDWTWTYTFTDEPCPQLRLSFVPDCLDTHQWLVTNEFDVAVTAWYDLGKSVLVPANGTATFTTDGTLDFAMIVWGGKGTDIPFGFDKELAGADRTDCNYTPPPQPVLIPVTPEITYTDPCGTADDTVDGVTKTGYTFVVDEVAGTVTFTAVPGYYLSGPTTLTAPWTDVPCPLEATPVNPTVVQSDECEVEGSYTIPDTPGVQYLIDGEPVEPGTYDGPIAETVTAEAVGNTVLTIEDWSFDLVVTPASDCEVAPTEGADVCTNIKGAQAEVPEGYTLVEGLCVTDEVAPTEGVAPTAPVVGPVVVPTAVDAGLAGPTSAGTGMGSPLGLALISAGLMMLLAAGALQAGRRERGTHEI